ncbi:MAG: hypothetical protein LWW79_08760 [Holophagaceae bacterium]|nr:hypothetical protein [Holophagaceae bacterium]
MATKRKVPRGGYVSPLQRLIIEAVSRVTEEGPFRTPAGPWLAAAEHYLRCQVNFRLLSAQETPEWAVTFQAGGRGLIVHFEGEDLVVVADDQVIRPPKPVSQVAVAVPLLADI